MWPATTNNESSWLKIGLAEIGDFHIKLNLQAVRSKKIKHLSKGYKQRLKLFIALSNDKPVLVLDEPFDGFDPIQLLDILALIKQENRKGRTTKKLEEKEVKNWNEFSLDCGMRGMEEEEEIYFLRYIKESFHD